MSARSTISVLAGVAGARVANGASSVCAHSSASASICRSILGGRGGSARGQQISSTPSCRPAEVMGTVTRPPAEVGRPMAGRLESGCQIMRRSVSDRPAGVSTPGGTCRQRRASSVPKPA